MGEIKEQKTFSLPKLSPTTDCDSVSHVDLGQSRKRIKGSKFIGQGGGMLR